VASGEEPILLAARSASEDPADSGWQFLCASGRDESAERAQVWSLSEVLERNPDLVSWVDSPAGTRLERKTEESPWRRVK
jgi:hypothetical protein